MNNGRFIYVFDGAARDLLLAAGYTLLMSDEKNRLFAFSRGDNVAAFSFDGIEHITSDTLHF